MDDLGLSSSLDTTELIKDGTEASFMADVIDASQKTPIIVDFWAPWCGPCKTMGPILEAAVKAAKGAVRMVKINVDQAKVLAGQLQIQSIPTVYAFIKGQPADGLQGAVPASQIKEFVQRIVAAGGGGEAKDTLEEAVSAAEELLTQGATVDAAQLFARVLSQKPNHAGAYAGLIRTHIAMHDLDQAEAILNGVPEEISEAAEIESVYAQLNLAKKARNVAPVDDLETKLNADPNDHQARYDLAQALFAKGEGEQAVDQLLEIYRRDQGWNDGAAKAELLTIFEALKPNDPVVLNGRRKLSSMIFA